MEPKEQKASYERFETVENEEIVELLKELKEVDTSISNMVTASEEAKDKFDSTLMIRQKIVDKMKPIVEEQFDGLLDEFEVLTNVVLEEDGSVNAKIVNELEAWKEHKRKAKEVKHETEAESQESLAKIIE